MINTIERKNINLFSSPSPFDGIWKHWTQDHVKTNILNNGWAPEKNIKTKYGTAIYFYSSDVIMPPRSNNYNTYIECVFALSANQTKLFNDKLELMNYLEMAGIEPDFSTKQGSHPNNKKIQNHFLQNGINAIFFNENTFKTIAIYDPDKIYIVI